MTEIISVLIPKQVWRRFENSDSSVGRALDHSSKCRGFKSHSGFQTSSIHTNSPVSTLSHLLNSIFSSMEYLYCKGRRDGSPWLLPQLLQGEYLYQMNPWNDSIFLMGLFIISKVFFCLLCHGVSVCLSVSCFAWFALRDL